MLTNLICMHTLEKNTLVFLIHAHFAVTTVLSNHFFQQNELTITFNKMITFWQIWLIISTSPTTKMSCMLKYFRSRVLAELNQRLYRPYTVYIISGIEQLCKHHSMTSTHEIRDYIYRRATAYNLCMKQSIKIRKRTGTTQFTNIFIQFLGKYAWFQFLEKYFWILKK